MKTFKQLIAEVAQPNNEDELNFKQKHSIEVMDHPVSKENQHSAEKKSPKRRADYDEGEDEDVYEAKLDPVGQEDDDIDNDGDVDDSDEYLAARRKAIAKAMQKESFGLDESLNMPEIGRRLQKMAPKEKNDIISNAMANLGDHLESFGTPFGAKNMKDLVKKTGLNAQSIQMLIRKASATNEAADSPYAIGMASAMKSTGDETPLKKSTITKAHKIAKGIMKDDEVDESAFIAKAAGAHKEGKRKFKLGDKEFPVTIKKATADKIVGEETEQIDEISDKLRARYLDKAVQNRHDFFHGPSWDPKKEPKWSTPGGKPKKGYYDQPHKVKAREKDKRRGEIIDKTAEKLTGKPHYSKMSDMTKPAIHGNASDWWKGKKYSTESVGLNESTPDKMISSLISAINKHSDKREFQKASEIFELWAERYPGSYKKLLATPGIAGSFFSDLVDVLDIRVDLDEEIETIYETFAKDYSGMLGSFKKAVERAEAAKKMGDTEKMGMHLDRARSYLFGLKSTDIAKLKIDDHHERYKKMKDLKESDQIDEMKQPYVVIDTADGNKVVAMASDEQDAKRSIASAERPPMRIKDKSTLKIVKTHKKQDIGYPLKEEINENLGKASKKMKFWFNTNPRDVKNRLKNADPAFVDSIAKQPEGKLGGPAELQRRLAVKMKMKNEEIDLTENFKAGSVKLNDGSSVLVKDQDAKLLNQLFADLNAGNRSRMMKVAMTDKNGFNEILGFAREAL
jgi:hypothetical protein